MNPEDVLRRTLRDRAEEIEPAPDSYARLAARVTEARTGPEPWWRSPQLLWLATAATAAAALIVVGALVLDDRGDDFVATPQPTEVPDQATTPPPASTADDVPTPTPTGPQQPTGVPDRIIWPVAATESFGEWPTSPEDAARRFVRALRGWELPVGSVTFQDPTKLLADVVLQSIGEDGQPFGEAARVRLAGGFDADGVQRWGVRWLRSDRIQVDDSFWAGPRGGPQQFVAVGRAHTFEGTIDVTIVDQGGSVVAEGFATGGGTELQEILGGPVVLEHPGGPGFAVLADLGGLGTVPSTLTIVAVDIPAATENPPERDPARCSARDLDPPEPDPDLPEPVEATRQAIAAAAIACDYEALAALTDSSSFTYSFGSSGDPGGFWRESERRSGEVLRFMVETLKLDWVPDDTTGTTYYTWPGVFTRNWSEVPDAERDALRPLYGDNDFLQWDQFGGFFGWRHGIDDRGTWRFFVAGD